jgi:ParB-like chromosome segregation protein Spo0J
MHQIEIKYKPLSALRERKGNPRTHTDEQVEEIARSITEFGFTNPLLIDEGDEIIAGHGRKRAAKKLGLSEVPTIELRGLSEDQRRAYVIADNKLALNAGWDSRLLAMDINLLAEANYDLTLTGFDESELLPLTGDVQESEFPDLSSSDRAAFQQMTFVLHDDQVEIVKAAIRHAKKCSEFGEELNTNRNGNGLARVCSDYLARHGNGSDEA